LTGVILPDPASGGAPYSVQTFAAGSYQRFMFLTIGGQTVFVQDVYPGLPIAIAISAIRYFAGATGRCVVVPTLLSASGTEGQPIAGTNLLSALRRGALIQIGAEICIVWSVSTGPGGSISIETSTVGTHTTADSLQVLYAIQTSYLTTITAGQAITEPSATYQVTTGIGTLSQSAVGIFVSAAVSFQPDDYISVGIYVDNLANLTEMKILFDVGDGSFTQNFYYYTVRPSDIAAAVANASTQLASAQSVIQRAVIDEENAAAAGGQLQTASSSQLTPGSGQWTQIVFPISALTRVGGDDTKSLQTLNKAQFLWNASGTINVATGQVIVFGQYQADVGDIGAPYLYRVRPRSMLTGVKGNPSPATRYGVNPRRGQVTVVLPSAAYDGQIDTWDIERYGGSVTSWRFIGSTPSVNATFPDNYSDDAAQGGDELEFDNFEPWPSVDVPNTGIASVVCGTVAVVASADPDIAAYLPGTLVQLGGLNVYTLWTRPVALGGTSYLLQFEENAGSGTLLPWLIEEPLIARQFLPYMWGPDVNGTVFAVGSPLHPGTLYFAKPFAPDSAPDAYNIEISPPSEALIGGDVLDGLSYVASTERWWALYPQPDNPAQRYNFVQLPFPRGLAAPYGKCNDGRTEYWWAKDGIWSSSEGSLTDADLYNLFPHEGVVGTSVTYAATGQVVQAPDYSRAGTFRLTYANYYLYALYQDVTGNYNVLVYDTRRKAWSVDIYSAIVVGAIIGLRAVTAFYHPEQQAGSLVASSTRFDELIMASAPYPANSVLAAVSTETVNTNDLGTATMDYNQIQCVLATFEYDGGDVRAVKQWGDFFVDALPLSRTPHLTVTPVSLSNIVAPPTSLAVTGFRTRQPISVGGIVVSDFLGLLFQWADDFTQQADPTRLYIWQPSLTVQPAATLAYKTFGTSFGLDGFKHVRQIAFAYVATEPVTVTITPYDGQAPAATLTLPSTGGAYQKALFPVPANKGLLYNFAMTSIAPWQLFFDDTEVYVGAWGRTGPYAVPRNWGGRIVEGAAI